MTLSFLDSISVNARTFHSTNFYAKNTGKFYYAFLKKTIYIESYFVFWYTVCVTLREYLCKYPIDLIIKALVFVKKLV